MGCHIVVNHQLGPLSLEVQSIQAPWGIPNHGLLCLHCQGCSRDSEVQYGSHPFSCL